MHVSLQKNSEILIINPTNSNIIVDMNISLGSIIDKKIVTIFLNNKKLDTLEVPVTMIGLQIDNLNIVPGTNTITLDTNEFNLVSDGLKEISFRVESISITKQP